MMKGEKVKREGEREREIDRDREGEKCIIA